ncbi:MAG: hypothetical protein FWG61_02095 [Firmicutes bacterium]|nr:hypothetical protein [Bacillota bacterium]
MDLDHNNIYPEEGGKKNYRRTSRRRKRGLWRHLLLQLAGLSCCAAIIILSAICWGYIIYSRLGYITGEELLPFYIFFGAIFISSCLITALARGGAIFPVVLFALLINAIFYFLTEISPPPLMGVFLRFALSLLTAGFAFTITKLLVMNKRRS